MNDCKSYGIPLSEVCDRQYFDGVCVCVCECEKINWVHYARVYIENKHVMCLDVDSNALFTNNIECNRVASGMGLTWTRSIAFDLLSLSLLRSKHIKNVEPYRLSFVSLSVWATIEWIFVSHLFESVRLFFFFFSFVMLTKIPNTT